ncbi:hypothetical protein JCM11641_005335 [Rhodosporidiobolus odoratus]
MLARLYKRSPSGGTTQQLGPSPPAPRHAGGAAQVAGCLAPQQETAMASTSDIKGKGRAKDVYGEARENAPGAVASAQVSLQGPVRGHGGEKGTGSTEAGSGPAAEVTGPIVPPGFPPSHPSLPIYFGHLVPLSASLPTFPLYASSRTMGPHQFHKVGSTPGKKTKLVIRRGGIEERHALLKLYRTQDGPLRMWIAVKDKSKSGIAMQKAKLKNNDRVSFGAKEGVADYVLQISASYLEHLALNGETTDMVQLMASQDSIAPAVGPAPRTLGQCSPKGKEQAHVAETGQALAGTEGEEEVDQLDDEYPEQGELHGPLKPAAIPGSSTSRSPASGAVPSLSPSLLAASNLYTASASFTNPRPPDSSSRAPSPPPSSASSAALPRSASDAPAIATHAMPQRETPPEAYARHAEACLNASVRSEAPVEVEDKQEVEDLTPFVMPRNTAEQNDKIISQFLDEHFTVEAIAQFLHETTGYIHERVARGQLDKRQATTETSTAVARAPPTAAPVKTWTYAEEVKLREGRIAGVSIAQLAVELGRSEPSVCGKWHAFKNKWVDQGYLPRQFASASARRASGHHTPGANATFPSQAAFLPNSPAPSPVASRSSTPHLASSRSALAIGHQPPPSGPPHYQSTPILPGDLSVHQTGSRPHSWTVPRHSPPVYPPTSAALLPSNTVASLAQATPTPTPNSTPPPAPSTPGMPRTTSSSLVHAGQNRSDTPSTAQDRRDPPETTLPAAKRPRLAEPSPQASSVASGVKRDPCSSCGAASARPPQAQEFREDTAERSRRLEKAREGMREFLRLMAQEVGGDFATFASPPTCVWRREGVRWEEGKLNPEKVKDSIPL